MSSIVNAIKHSVKPVIFYFSYAIVSIFLVLFQPYLVAHLFTVVSIGYFVAGIILDIRKSTNYSLFILAVIGICVTHITDHVTYKHLSYCLIHAVTSGLLLNRLRKATATLTALKKKVIFFISTGIIANLTTSIIGLYLFYPTLSEWFELLTATALGSVVIVPFIVGFFQLRFDLSHQVQKRDLKYGLIFIGIGLLLTFLASELYWFNKFLFYISAALIVLIALYGISKFEVYSLVCFNVIDSEPKFSHWKLSLYKVLN